MAGSDIDAVVRELHDEFIKFRRTVEDALENLDFDNFSPDVKSALSKAGRYAAGFESGISDDGAYARMFAEFENEQKKALSEIRTAVDSESARIDLLTSFKTDLVGEDGDGGAFGELRSSVSQLDAAASAEAAKLEAMTEWKREAAEWIDTADGKFSGFEGDLKTVTDNISSFKAEVSETYAAKTSLSSYYKVEDFTADAAALTAALKGYADGAAENAYADALADAGDYTDAELRVITESMTKIEERADADGALIRMMVGNREITLDGAGNPVIDGGPVTPESTADFIMEAANGSSLIRLRADRIQLGAGAGVDNYGNLYTEKLFGISNVEATIGGITYPGWFYAEVDSSADQAHGEFGADFLIKSIDPITSGAGTLMYGFKYATTDGENAESVNFVIGKRDSAEEKSLIGYNYGQDKTFPKGVWDFSSCDAVGLKVYFS